MGYMAERNSLRNFHELFEGRRLEFRGKAVKHTTCKCCDQPISPHIWQLEDITGGPYDIPEGKTVEDCQWCAYEGHDGSYELLYQCHRSFHRLEDTDPLPKEQGRVLFTAIVGFADKEPSLDKIEYSSEPCPPEPEPSWARDVVTSNVGESNVKAFSDEDLPF